MNLNISLSVAKPQEPGTYLAYFPISRTWDVVSIIETESQVYRGEFYLMAINRGGAFANWHCLWSEKLPNIAI